MKVLMTQMKPVLGGKWIAVIGKAGEINKFVKQQNQAVRGERTARSVEKLFDSHSLSQQLKEGNDVSQTIEKDIAEIEREIERLRREKEKANQQVRAMEMELRPKLQEFNQLNEFESTLAADILSRENAIIKLRWGLKHGESA